MARGVVPALAVALATALPAQAIPAFARRYKTACTTCHSLPPQLNPFGLAFRANGYRLPSGEPHRNEDDVQLGAPEWEGLFPRSFLPGQLPETPPLAGFLKTSLESSAEGGKPRSEDIQLIAVLLAGGNLGKRASFFVEAAFGNKFGAGLGRAFLNFDQLAGPMLNVRVGQVEPAYIPWSSLTHRLTYTEYLGYENKVGLLNLDQSRPAVEVFGAGSDPGPLRGLRYALGVSSRAVTGGTTADGYARVSYKFGGIAAAGDRSSEHEAPPIVPLSENSLSVGAWVYRATLEGPASRLRANREGADATAHVGGLELMLGGWTGGDDLYDGASWAYLMGASVRPWPWLMLLARWEALYAPRAGAQRRALAGVRCALQQNVAVTIETTVGVPDADVGAVAGFFVGY